MASSNAPVRRVDLDPGLPGRDRVKIMLAARGFPTVAGWARSRGFHRTEVFMCLSGDRAYPEIVKALAEETGRPVDVIEALISQQKSAKANGDAA